MAIRTVMHIRRGRRKAGRRMAAVNPRLMGVWEKKKRSMGWSVFTGKERVT